MEMFQISYSLLYFIPNLQVANIFIIIIIIIIICEVSY